jgi:hypothetical protein
MARTAAPPSVDLAKVGEGVAWHIATGELVRPEGDQPGIVSTLCGRSGAPAKIERDVDAKAVSLNGSPLCADCRTTYDAGGKPEIKESTMATKTSEKKTTAPRTAKPKTTAKKSAAAPVTAPDLKAAIARAEKAIATQPKRTTAELSPDQAEKAFKLGKAIAADRWLLKKAKAGTTEAATVAGMVERIESRVQERNKIRLGN